MNLKLILPVALMLLIGCKSAYVMKTPSGKPEILVAYKPTPKLVKSLTDFFVSHGYIPSNQDPMNLKFDRPFRRFSLVPDVAYADRIKIRFDELVSGDIRIIGGMYDVRYANQVFEEETFDSDSNHLVQAYLNQFKASGGPPMRTASR